MSTRFGISPRPEFLLLRNGSEGARENIGAAGLKIVYDKRYPPATTDFAPIVRAIQAANPDIVFDAAPQPLDEYVVSPRAFASNNLGPVMDWFEALTGFRETTYADTRAKLRIEGNQLRSLINGRSYGVGELACLYARCGNAWKTSSVFLPVRRRNSARCQVTFAACTACRRTTARCFRWPRSSTCSR